MDLLAARINTVKTYLKSQYMLADSEWISGCVEYLTEDTSNHYTEKEIQNLAKEQWLLNDLKDICPGSLPPNLKNQRKTVLPGTYVLQINAAIDIGTPAYQQYLKLQKVNMENIDATSKFEDKIANHRMIKLYLTDGVQELTAIEYKPMRNLTCDITPGCKMLLKGPIECRRGVILLTESSVELLGGEVQEIVLTNSLAGLLSTKLSLPLPREQTNITTNTNNQQNNAFNHVPQIEIPSRIEVDNVSTTTNEQVHSRPIARVTSLQVANFNDDDIDFDQLEAIEAEISATNSKTQNSTVCNKNINSIASNRNSQMKIDSNSGCKRPSDHEFDVPDKRAKVNDVLDYPDDEDLFCEDEDYLRELEQKLDAQEGVKLNSIVKYPVKVPSEPYVYIKQLNEMSDAEKVGRKFKIKGQILKLISKLLVSKDSWSLKCTLIDGTGSIDADFTSDVLSKLVGTTPKEMNEFKKLKNHNPEVKQKAFSTLQRAREQLQVLYCIIELTMLETPTITELIPFNHTHVEQQKKRLDSAGL